MANYVPRILKMVDEKIYFSSDEEVSRLCPEVVTVYYGSNTYRDDSEYIAALKRAIWRDFEDMPVTSMEKKTLTRQESNRHANMTVIQVPIPLRDYLKLRHEKNALELK